MKRIIQRGLLAAFFVAGIAGIGWSADITSHMGSPVIKKYIDFGDGTYGEKVSASITGTPTVTVSGLPAAAALADNAANPTVPAVGAFGMVWDGSTWDRAPGTSADGITVNLGANNDVIQASHDNLNANANMQVANTDVGTANPVPVRETVESLTYTHSNVSVDNASEALVASNASRKSLIISNDSDTKIYINLAGGTASATAGIPLAAGGSLVMSAGEKFFTTSAITAITASGTSKSVNIAEGV